MGAICPSAECRRRGLYPLDVLEQVDPCLGLAPVDPPMIRSHFSVTKKLSAIALSDDDGHHAASGSVTGRADRTPERLSTALRIQPATTRRDNP